MAKVQIYSTPTCHFCHQAKDFFTANNVEFVDYDVASDEERRNEMIEKSGQMGVPVIVISKDDGGEELVVGFEENRIREALGM